MSATYRLIQFEPDPFTGARFPLGAVVAEPGGAVRVAKVERFPSASCLGDRALAVVVQRLHARLDSVASAEALPAAFGPYASLTEPREVPAGVADALQWVQALLSPPQQRKPEPQRTSRGAQRATIGYRFFETWRVADYVRKTFKPSSDWQGWLGQHAAGLQQISHWVAGTDEVLLMEPIVPTRPQFEQDLKDVAMKLGAYQFAMGEAKNGRRGSLVAYVTAGGHPDRRAHARETLAPFAHDVVDTDDASARAAFIERIRQVGTDGDPQQRMTPEA